MGGGELLTTRAGETTVLESGARPDDALQHLLLRFLEASRQGAPAADLIRIFCEQTRAFFQIDGVYFWPVRSADDLAQAVTEGPQTLDLAGRRLTPDQRALAAEAIRKRRTLFAGGSGPGRESTPADLTVRSMMVSPLVMANRVVGALIFLHDSESNYFNDDLAAKATILAGQLGGLLEGRQLIQVPDEPYLRPKVSVDGTRALHVVPDDSRVPQALADRLRVLLGTRLVCVLSRQGETVKLHAVASDSPERAASIRSRFDRKAAQFAGDLAGRALAAGEPISVAIDSASHALGDWIPAGTLLAAPIHLSDAAGAVLIYPRERGAFTPQEKSLVAAVSEFGAIAMANTQFFATDNPQVRERRELLEIRTELKAELAPELEAVHLRDLSQENRQRAKFLESLAQELNSELRLVECARIFASRTAEWMRAQAAVFAVQRGVTLETLVLHGLRDSRSNAFTRRIENALTEALAQYPGQIIYGRGSEILGSELSSQLGWNDCVLVRMVGPSGEPVGVLCLANRGDLLQAQDGQLLLSLAGLASLALENARQFTRMDQANRHWIELFDAITDFIVAHDESDHILRVNRPLAEFIGVQPHELIGMNMGALLAIGDDAPLQSCPFCRTTADISTDEFVLPVLDRTYLVSTSRVHGTSREGLQTIHVLKDITDRREAERRYRELFDNIQEGVFFSTPDGRFVEVNDALVRILGYRSREELLKVDVRSQVCVSPHQYEELAAQMQQHNAVRNHEETLCRQDGSHVQVLINAFAVRDAQQRMVQYRGVMLDISGLKTFQSELQRERDFSGKILNNTQSLILVADTAGLVSYANRRWYEMGYQQNELLSRPLEELIIPARRQALSEAFAATLAGQQVDNLEVRIDHGEGRVGYFSMNLSPMRDEQGNVASIVVVMSDITDAATLQAKLLHTEKMAAVGQLVSGVAHEVNNPLTAILGFADLLMENPEVPETARKDLRVILEQAQRTKQIVQNLLSFARQMPPQRKPLQLNAILSRTVQLRAYDLHSRGAQVIEEFDPDLPQTIGDAHQLQQVFLNILNNAYDAVRDTGRPARIEIRTAHLGDLVEISFRDNGYGISFPERIFDPFFTTKEIGKGTGLGLSICYGIVREHGGEILCHNNTDGEGATFIVHLPIGMGTTEEGNTA